MIYSSGKRMRGIAKSFFKFFLQLLKLIDIDLLNIFRSFLWEKIQLIF